MKPCFALAALLALCAPGTVLAGEPSDAVRYFYSNIGSETEPDNRDRFTDPARTQLDLNERTSTAAAVGCIDFVLGIDAQDMDEQEIGRTLQLAETVTGDTAQVLATFRLFNEPRAIDWSLKKVDGAWKVSDVASETSGWRLSRFDCGHGG